MIIFDDKTFVAKLVDIAKNKKTLYVLGAFGFPLNDYNKKRTINQYESNAKEPRRTNIMNSNANTFGFDCVCLIKALLWGWNANTKDNNGGAKYGANGVPDINETSMINMCSGISTDFSKIAVGEAVWIPGHIGIYIGDGLAIECSPKWKNGVQFTACNCNKTGYNRRDWQKHGKLPWIKYEENKFTEKVKTYQMWLNANYNSGLEVDGRVGAKTRTATVKALQVELNVFGSRLVVDGGFGAKTKEALNKHMIVKGTKGGLAFIVQGLLYSHGIDPNGFDGSVGDGCYKAIKFFQSSKGLEVDGKVGSNTFAKLLG